MGRISASEGLYMGQSSSNRSFSVSIFIGWQFTLWRRVIHSCMAIFSSNLTRMRTGGIGSNRKRITSYRRREPENWEKKIVWHIVCAYLTAHTKFRTQTFGFYNIVPVYTCTGNCNWCQYCGLVLIEGRAVRG